MAPPLISRPRSGRPPRKLLLGAWMLPAMAWLAKGKALRGTAFDVFGYTHERRLERELIAAYEARVAELLEVLSLENRTLAVQIAAIPMTMRGYGHVKIANVALARAREIALLHRLLPERYGKPPSSGPKAGEFRGITVVAG